MKNHYLTLLILLLNTSGLYSMQRSQKQYNALQGCGLIVEDINLFRLIKFLHRQHAKNTPPPKHTPEAEEFAVRTLHLDNNDNDENNRDSTLNIDTSLFGLDHSESTPAQPQEQSAAPNDDVFDFNMSSFSTPEEKKNGSAINQTAKKRKRDYQVLSYFRQCNQGSLKKYCLQTGRPEEEILQPACNKQVQVASWARHMNEMHFSRKRSSRIKKTKRFDD